MAKKSNALPKMRLKKGWNTNPADLMSIGTKQKKALRKAIKAAEKVPAYAARVAILKANDHLAYK